MTNWPSIQELRKFESKFIDNSKYEDLKLTSSNTIPSTTTTTTDTTTATASASTNVNESITTSKTKIIDSDDLNFIENNNNNKSVENLCCKTVRCVMKKNIQDSIKKYDRGDGLNVNQENPKTKTYQQNPIIVDDNIINKIRMENHLKWKKQKDYEYSLKKQAEKLALEKEKQINDQKEKLKKLKEREREEKLREWEKQKAKEKEEKKKEKIVLNVLKNEMKVVTPIVDKDKLIEEWVKLKDKQRQSMLLILLLLFTFNFIFDALFFLLSVEAEKKAEILKREEESRALRQNLAALSYRQWKERLKGRTMTLPKNGYRKFFLIFKLIFLCFPFSPLLLLLSFFSF